MFKTSLIVGYPTDTSYGLGVRADDAAGLDRLYALKQRPSTQYTSLMVKDWAMLEQFAQVPESLPRDFFTARPRTVILKPKSKLPHSPYWPEDAVGFRVATRPEVAAAIDFPITTTSANLSGQPNIYDPVEISAQWGSEVVLFPGAEKLDDRVSPSEIWDYTEPENPVRIR